jgi:hypothetical protein
VRAVHIVEERQGRAQTKNPRKRAAEVYEFVEGDAEVLCAGVQAVQLGHNLDAASAVVLTGLPWSFSALSQFEARVHRLTQHGPIGVTRSRRPAARRTRSRSRQDRGSSRGGRRSSRSRSVRARCAGQ